MDWSTTAFLLPGQGSQYIGMGADFAAQYPTARATFEEADDLLGYALSALMFAGEESELAQTIHTQPAMYVSSVAIARVLREQLPQAQPVALAGHSLGEFTAFTLAGALAFADGVRLVQARAQAMQAAGNSEKGGMAAILNLSSEQIITLCHEAQRQTGKPVVLANDNCPGQIVISGEETALEVAMSLAKEAGAKRALRLNVSTANHSPLMQSAQDTFQQAVATLALSDAQTPVYANITAEPLSATDSIRHEMKNQMTSAVQWTRTIQNMARDGVQTFVEVGAKDVLSGLVKRIDSAVNVTRVGDIATLEVFLAQAQG